MCIRDRSQRATKQETELRVAHAAELVAEGQAYSSITSLVAAKYGISRRRARQITSNAYLLLKDDLEELAYYNKIRKEMDDMKKEPVKKGIPLNWDTPEGMGK